MLCQVLRYCLLFENFTNRNIIIIKGKENNRDIEKIKKLSWLGTLSGRDGQKLCLTKAKSIHEMNKGETILAGMCIVPHIGYYTMETMG